MRLSQLTRLGRADLEKEMAELRTTIAELESILADQAKLRGVIKTELGEIREDVARDHDRVAHGLELFEDLPNLDPGAWVEPGRGLGEQQHGRIVDEGASEADAPRVYVVPWSI